MAPLELTARMIDPTSHRPRYLQLADVVRTAIVNGYLRPDEALPSEGAMATSSGLSKTTVRQALDVLEREGRIVRRAGVAARVAGEPRVRVVNIERYRQEMLNIRKGTGRQESAFTRDHGIVWTDYQVDVEVVREPANPVDQELLQLDAGAYVVRRRFVKWAAGIPLEIQRSTLPAVIADDTHLADPDVQPYPGGTLRELASIDITVTRAREKTLARVPDETEVRALRMERQSAVVLETLRTFYADKRPVEASRVILPASTHRLIYETDLTI